MLTLDSDALARHKNSTRWNSDKSLRAVGFRLDSEGIGLAVELPSPGHLAAMLRLDGVDAFRRGSAIVTRPTGSTEEPKPLDLTDAGKVLLQVLGDLQERPDAERPYRDLVLASSTVSPRVAGYALDVLRALRDGLQVEPKPERAPRPKGPTKSRADVHRDARARRRDAEVAVSRWWLEGWLADEDDALEPGSRHLGADLLALAVEVLEDLEADGEEYADEDETVAVVVPGPRNFYDAADDVLGPRRRSKQGITYTVPKEENMTARPPMFTREELLAEMARQEREALADTAATTTTEATNVRHLRAV